MSYPANRGHILRLESEIKVNYSWTFRSKALPTETKVESGTSQSKSGTSVNLSNSGF